MTNARTLDFHLATDNDNRLRASGAITFANAAQALACLPDARGAIDVDLSGLVKADSATLAVLIAWAAHARAQGGVLRYLHAPVALRNLAHLSDLDSLLLA